MGSIGASQASGIVGATNAVTGGVNSAINNSLLYNAINRNQTVTANPSAYSPVGNNPYQGLGVA
jgi:hypothetical protein